MTTMTELRTMQEAAPIVRMVGFPGHIVITGPALPRVPPPKEWPEAVHLLWLIPDTRGLFLWFAPIGAWLPLAVTDEQFDAVAARI